MKVVTYQLKLISKRIIIKFSTQHVLFTVKHSLIRLYNYSNIFLPNNSHRVRVLVCLSDANRLLLLFHISALLGIVDNMNPFLHG